MDIFIPTPLKVGGHIAFAFSGILEFRTTTSSLRVYNWVKFNSTVFDIWHTCWMKGVLREKTVKISLKLSLFLRPNLGQFQ
jgi:hypothetical protein